MNNTHFIDSGGFPLCWIKMREEIIPRGTIRGSKDIEQVTCNLGSHCYFTPEARGGEGWFQQKKFEGHHNI
jgi:hypothetical protein